MPTYDFWQTLSDAVDRAVNLRVITLVGDAAITGDLTGLKVVAPADKGQSLVTDINLVGGDITQIISEKFLGPDYADLRSGHQASVKQAQDIVERNVNILVTVFKEFGSLLGTPGAAGNPGTLPAPSAGPARTP